MNNAMFAGIDTEMENESKGNGIRGSSWWGG
jgi:hypothetical protein